MKRSIDYEFKAHVLNNYPDLLKQVNKSKLYEYALCKGDYGEELSPSLQRLLESDVSPMLELRSYCFQNGQGNEFLECCKILNASYHRIKRLRERVTSILLNGKALFITLTFTDDTLANTTAKERRVAVTRYLKSCNGQYVGNIDFGKINHREHYHALIGVDSVNVYSWHKFGAIKIEKVRNKDLESDSRKLSKYVAKLSNHCIKETTKRSALIYSR